MSGSYSGSTFSTTTTYYPPVVTLPTVYDAATITGPVSITDGGANVTTSLTGGDPTASLTVTNPALLQFLGDVTVDSLVIHTDRATTSGVLTIGAGGTLDLLPGPLSRQASNIGLVGTTDAAGLINNGTIQAAGGTTADPIEQIAVASFANAGALDVGADTTLIVTSADFTNTGSITLASGAVLALALDSTLAALPGHLGTVTNSGGTLAVTLSGSIDNTGTVLDAAAANALGVVGIGQQTTYAGLVLPGISASLTGGTLDLSDGSLRLGDTTLDGVAVRGTLHLLNHDRVTLAGGTSFTGAGGIGPGSIDLAGPATNLSVTGDLALANTAVSIAAAGAGDFSSIYASGTLSLDAASLLDLEAGGATPGVLQIGAHEVVNSGTIHLADAARRLVFQNYDSSTPAIHNTGLIAIGTGDTLSVGGAVTGAGTITLAGNDSLSVAGTIDGASIVLSGGGNAVSIADIYHSSFSLSGLALGDTLDLGGTIVTSLTTSGGRVHLYNGTTELGSFASTDSLAGADFVLTHGQDSGGHDYTALSLLDPAQLTAPGGYHAPANASIVINGDSIDNSGGLLLFNNDTLEFTGAVTEAGSISLGIGGTLVLDQLAGFHATLTPGTATRIVLPSGNDYALNLAGGTLEVLQGGTVAASFDVGSQLDLSGVILDQSGAAPVISIPTPGIAGSGPAGQMFLVNDLSSHQSTGNHGESYSGPVAGLAGQFIHITPDNVNIATSSPNVFIRTGGGDDAVQVVTGDNVIDASTGSNFLVGGSGHDTFFMDTRGGQTLWDTISGFHAGDAVTIWGFTAGTSGYSWADGLGAAGYTGLTLQIAPSGDTVLAKTTFAGLSSADLSHLTVQTGSVAGNDYLSIIHT